MHPAVLLAHDLDSQCHVDPATDSCRECGTYHGDPCPECTGRAFHFGGCSRIEVSATNETSADQATNHSRAQLEISAADDRESATTSTAIVNLFDVERMADSPDGHARSLGFVPADLLPVVARMGYAPGSYLAMEWSGPEAQREDFIGGLPTDWRPVGEWLLTKLADGEIGMVDLLDEQRRAHEEIECQYGDAGSAYAGVCQ